MTPESPPVTVADLVAYWKQFQSKRLSPRSLTDRLRTVGYFAADLGDRPAESVTVANVLAWFDSNPSVRHASPRHSRKRGWSCADTRRHVAIAIGHLFKLAVKHGLIREHRLASLLENFPKENLARRAVTDDEFRAMLTHGSDNNWRVLLIFLRETAARPGEAIALTWPDIDWEAGVARLAKHKTYRHTRKPRIIPLSSEALRVLCLLEAVPHEPAGHVFLNAAGRPWTDHALSGRMRSLRVRAGIPPDAYLHGLRHSCLTELAAAGAPVKLVSELAGHSSIEVTERFYLHLSGMAGRLREVLDQYGSQSSYAKYLTPPARPEQVSEDQLRDALDSYQWRPQGIPRARPLPGAGA